MRSWLFCVLIFLTGCQSTSDAAKWLIPINAGAAYFGTIGIHEGAHALTAKGLGSNDIDIELLPSRDENGTLHFGLTQAESTGWSPSDEALFHAMGPTANAVSHIALREALKSGVIPSPLQPTLAWLSLGNQLAFYYHAGLGLARISSADLGKEEVWISATLLLGGLTYDIYDLATDGDKGFRVLFGEHFYGEDSPRVRPVSAVLPGGGYFGFRVEW